MPRWRRNVHTHIHPANLTLERNHNLTSPESQEFARHKAKLGATDASLKDSFTTPNLHSKPNHPPEESQAVHQLDVLVHESDLQQLEQERLKLEELQAELDSSHQEVQKARRHPPLPEHLTRISALLWRPKPSQLRTPPLTKKTSNSMPGTWPPSRRAPEPTNPNPNCDPVAGEQRAGGGYPATARYLSVPGERTGGGDSGLDR